MTILYNPLSARTADSYLKSLQIILAGNPATGSELLTALQNFDQEPEQQTARLRQALELYPQSRHTAESDLALILAAIGEL